MEDFIFCREWKQERHEKREKMKQSRTGMERGTK